MCIPARCKQQEKPQVKAAGQEYARTIRRIRVPRRLRHRELAPYFELRRLCRLVSWCFKRYRKNLYDESSEPLTLKSGC